MQNQFIESNTWREKLIKSSSNALVASLYMKSQL
jgi:hypothetical protein